MTMTVKHMLAVDIAARHTPAADMAKGPTAAMETRDTKSSGERAEEYLTQLPYWDMLSQEDQELVRHNTTMQRYEKGQFIHSDLYDCLGMVLVLQGEIRTYLLSEEGREVTLFRLYEGDPCVFSASCAIRQITFEVHMTAEQDCTLLVVRTGAFAELTRRNVYVRCLMYELMLERFSSVMWSMQQILFHGFDRRLAAFLIGEYDRTGVPVIQMTHEQIAQHTSSAREVVARMLKRFATDGLVEVRRGSIRLTSPDDLRKLIES